MAGAHLRGGRRGPDRVLVVSVVVALVLGALLGGGLTLLFDDDDASVGTTAGSDQDLDGVAGADPTDGPAAARTEPITIAFAGDINVEGSLTTRLENDPSTFVGPFADLLRSADLAIGNLEATLGGSGEPVDKEFVFRAPPSVLDALAAGGFDVISAANDHGMDFGPTGLDESIGIKRSRPDGMVIGIGEDEDEAYAPYLADVGGHTVAVLAATQVIDASRIESSTATADQGGLASAKRVDRLVEEVQAVRERADTVVVYVHWGIETETCPSASQQELARALTDAGADLVVGTHAHRVQGAGRLGAAFVGYGLGNFLFGAVDAEGGKSGVLLVEVDGREVLGFQWAPGRVSDRVPIPLEGDEAVAAVDEWNGLRACTDLVG